MPSCQWPLRSCPVGRGRLSTMSTMLTSMCPDALWCLALLHLLAGMSATVTESAPTGTKCLKNEDFGDYPTNTYYCNDPELPECCEVEQEFTCCEAQGSHTMKHQLILWGAVFGVVGLVAIIWVCYRKDTYMCEGETINARLKRCCGCEKKVNPEDEKVELSDLSDSAERMKWPEDMTTGTDVDYYNDVPVTSRGVTPIVKGNDTFGGNDSDSGRGSTTSIDGSRHLHVQKQARDHELPATMNQGVVPQGGNAIGYDDQSIHAQASDNASVTKEKKKKKKGKKKKKQPLHDVAEEDITDV